MSLKKSKLKVHSTRRFEISSPPPRAKWKFSVTYLRVQYLKFSFSYYGKIFLFSDWVTKLDTAMIDSEEIRRIDQIWNITFRSIGALFILRSQIAKYIKRGESLKETGTKIWLSSSENRGRPKVFS